MNEQQVDVNTVIQKLSNKLADAYLSISILEARLETQEGNSEDHSDSSAS